MNNLFQELNNPQNLNNNSNNGLTQFINSFKNSSNPQQFLSKYIQNNPQAQNMYFMLQNSNKSPKEMFYLMAEKRGIDPNSIINMLK